jgi:hypothetical protein
LVLEMPLPPPTHAHAPKTLSNTRIMKRLFFMVKIPLSKIH